MRTADDLARSPLGQCEHSNASREPVPRPSPTGRARVVGDSHPRHQEREDSAKQGWENMLKLEAEGLKVLTNNHMNMNNQKGFANIFLIVIVVILAGAAGYFALRQPAQQTQVVQPETNQQPSNGTPNSNNPPQVSIISSNIFKNATYRITFAGKDADITKEFTMTNGFSTNSIADFPLCNILGLGIENELAITTIDQDKDRGVVVINCSYGASFTDVFLVAFKNLNGVPVQTDVVDLRKHSVLLSHNLSRVGVKQISLESSGVLTVTALVVPEALRNAPGYQQSATEPVTITYHLDSQGRITE
jgi:hypothetical protein